MEMDRRVTTVEQQGRIQAQQLQQVLVQLMGSGLPVTQQVVDNFSIGSFFVCLARTIQTTDTIVTVKLGRQPSGYIVIRNQSGNALIDGANHGSDWTPGQIVVRSTGAASVYSFLVF